MNVCKVNKNSDYIQIPLAEATARSEDSTIKSDEDLVEIYRRRRKENPKET